MEEELLTTREAARRLGISPATLYDWLEQSDRGRFMLRGQRVSIDYFQGGPRGQGRIRIPVRVIAQLQELMRVHPHVDVPRRPPTPAVVFPGIHVRLGKPQ